MYFCLNSFSLKKLLIIRFSSIGDIILTTPVLRCIKQQLGVEVHYLTKISFSGLLQHNPYVDALHCIDKEACFFQQIEALKLFLNYPTDHFEERLLLCHYLDF